MDNLVRLPPAITVRKLPILGMRLPGMHSRVSRIL